MASVITMSSGFFVVLYHLMLAFSQAVGALPVKQGAAMWGAYIAESPLFDGDMCETIDFSRSVIVII
jgi:hypothetical protein